jgi:hypothetical protein
LSATESPSGRGLTRAEVFALGTVALLVVMTLGPLLLGADRKARQANTLTRCQENLRQLGAALRAYGEDWKALPVSAQLSGPQPELVGALGRGYVADPRVFFCPADAPPSPVPDAKDAQWRSSTIGYFYFSAEAVGPDARLSKFLQVEEMWPRRLAPTMPADTWVMSDIWYSGVPTTHAEYKKGVNFLMLDGRVDFVSEGIRTVFH